MRSILSIIIGFISGYLSGQFGIGGGLITTPAIRIVLDRSAFIALGTPLVVIIPTAFSGIINYSRSRLVDWELGLKLALFGLVGTAIGALSTTVITGDVLMLITSIVIFIVALRFLGLKAIGLDWKPKDQVSINITTALIGIISGFYSGLLGLGGGVIAIPAIIIFLGKPLKKTLGTSLIVVAILAVPSLIIHYLLNHVDLKLALFLIIGTVPGAYLGSKVAIRIKEKTLNMAFGIFLIIVAAYFAAFEIVKLLAV